MGEQRMRPTQLMALLWAGMLAPAADLLPGATLPAAGRAAWLSVLLAGVIFWALGRTFLRVSQGVDPAGLLLEGLGPVFGRAILTIYIVWGVLLLALRLRLCAARLVGGEEQSGSAWVVLLTIAALALWFGRGTAAALVRTGQVFFGVLLGLTAAVLLLSLPQVRMERIVPFAVQQLPGVAEGSVTAAGALAWGLFGVFLLAETEQGRPWNWGRWSLGSGALLAVPQIIVVGKFGTGLAMRLDNPFFALAKSVGVEGAFQRIESLMLSVWLLSDLAMAGVLLLALRTAVKGMYPGWKTSRTAPVAVSAAVLLSGVLFSDRGSLRIWNRMIVPNGNLILAAVLLITLWIAQRKCGKKCAKHISCGEKKE